MKDIDFEIIQANGINLRIASMGEGPLVIFCHGWPESWYSYRHQLPAIAEAGYRAVAYDVRGYGESDKPHAIAAYAMRLLTQDVIGIVEALGYDEAITVGHDWGGPIALNTAALFPEVISATGSLSVPYFPRGPLSALDLFRQIYKGKYFYQLYFQAEGVAEKEFEADLDRALRLTYTNSDGRGMSRSIETNSGAFGSSKGPDSTFLEGMFEFEALPAWLTQRDIDYFASQFEMSGLRGPLNRYRAQDIDWAEMTDLPDQIEQPAFFITGALDPVNFFIPGEETLIDRIKPSYKNLQLTAELPGIGHWTQQESPEEVNGLILQFLSQL